MKKIGVDFNHYVHLVCQYAYLEYDFGLKSNFVLFHLNQDMIELLGTCWITCMTVPDAASMLADDIKKTMNDGR